jgi:hypothetical protein
MLLTSLVRFLMWQVENSFRIKWWMRSQLGARADTNIAAGRNLFSVHIIGNQ